MGALMVRAVTLRSVSGAEAGRKVTWLELFFDLAFVAAVSQAGAPLAHHYSPEGLLRYGVLLFLIWWAWLGQTLYSTRFDTDDVIQRVLTLAQVFGVAVMAINADDALASRSSAGFAAAYAGLRLLLVAEYVRARHVRRARNFATRTAVGTGIAGLAWLLSAVTPAPARFVLWALALACEIGTPLLTVRHTADVPPDAAHLPERFGLFTIILLGESLVSVMRGMKSQEAWTVAAASSASLGMVVAFTLWWWYFDGVEGARHRHVRSKADAWLLHVWTFAHLPLYLGIGIAGIGAEHAIMFAPTQHLHATEAWLLCGSLALAMIAMTVIAATRPTRQDGPRRRAAIGAHAALATMTLLVGAAGTVVNAAAFLLALSTLTLCQLIVSLASASPGSSPRVTHDRTMAAIEA